MAKNLRKIILIVSILFVGCSPQKRLQRLIKKHPELVEIKYDTIRLRDTIYIENYIHDTVNEIRFHDTTIIVNNEKTFARYFYDTLRQEIYHEIECKGDTVYYYKEIPFKVSRS